MQVAVLCGSERRQTHWKAFARTRPLFARHGVRSRDILYNVKVMNDEILLMGGMPHSTPYDNMHVVLHAFDGGRS